MSSTELEEQKELSLVAREILDRTNYMKEQIKNNMVVKENDIIKGIIIFEEIVKEINPITMNDNIELLIHVNVDKYMINMEDRTQHVNRYVNYGINRCYMLLYNYNRSFFNTKYMKKVK